jgi:hypothetical protein
VRPFELAEANIGTRIDGSLDDDELIDIRSRVCSAEQYGLISY